MTRPTDHYLTLKALATYSGIGVRTLRDKLTDRVRPLPHYRVGGKILVRQSEFDQWVSQFRVQASATAITALVNGVLQGLV